MTAAITRMTGRAPGGVSYTELGQGAGRSASCPLLIRLARRERWRKMPGNDARQDGPAHPSSRDISTHPRTCPAR